MTSSVNQGQDASPKKQIARPLDWMVRKDWEEIEHLAETALKMLESSVTKDMAITLADKVQVCVDHMKMLTAENKGVQS